MARNRHAVAVAAFPLLGDERTCPGGCPTSELDPERPSAPPPVIPTSALIIIALATVIQPRRFDQDGVSLPDGRPPWVTLGGQGAPNEFLAEPGTS